MDTTRTLAATAAVSLILAVALAPAPAHARDLELSAGSGLLAARSTTVDAVTDDDLIGLAALRFALELPELGRGRFVELAWRIGSTSATDFQDIDAELQLEDVEVAFRLERVLARRVRAFARAGLALTTADLSLDAGGIALVDDARTVSAIGGVGADLIVLRAGVLELGLRAEVGLRVGGSLDFAPTPDVDGDDARIRTQAAEVGGMDLSGLTAGFALVGRF